MSIDSTESGSSATSYISVSAANSYFDEQWGYSDWESNIIDEDKERLLRTATKQIDQLHNKYYKLTSTQSLRFPVSYNESDLDTDETWDDGFEKAQEACCIQAYYLYEMSESYKQQHFNRAAGIMSESAGGNSSNFSGFNRRAKYHPEVLRILSDYIDTSVTIKRG